MAAITWEDVWPAGYNRREQKRLQDLHTRMQVDILAHVNVTLAVNLIDGEDGPKTKLARIYYAAHFATITRGVGPIASESAGGVSVSYVAQPIQVGDGLTATTVYGRSYLQIIRRSAARGPVVL